MSPASIRESPTSPEVGASDLTPEILGALQALADVEARYRAERDRLGQWSGPRVLKERFLAQLEERHARERQPLVQRLADLQQEMTSAKMFAGVPLH
ncbi:hypothetical protein [Microvirga massiliensis]|uniref:hypothetical protein n=1 Tax=Microvirga massiliensis TaxID=1033741 RepID=UPI0006612916|nr:hypothetical protein [Microvirga massiliensis]